MTTGPSKLRMKDLAKTFMEIKDSDEMVEYLYALFTLAELDTIVTRLDIVRMLKKGIPQHDIAKKLGVGVGTVTHGSLELKKGRFSNISWRPS